MGHLMFLFFNFIVGLLKEIGQKYRYRSGNSEEVNE
jgi:hypothetical protein